MYNYTAFEIRFSNSIAKNKDSILREDVLRSACTLLKRFDNYLQQLTLNKWADIYNIPRTQLEYYLTGEEKEDKNSLDFVRAFLMRYSIRQNIITGEYIIRRDGKTFTYDELVLECSLQKINSTILSKYLDFNNKNITIVETFNPLDEFFRKIAKEYNGYDNIGKLADCIVTYNFNEPEKSKFYQEQMRYYLHKWLCKAAGMAMDIGVNNVMLLWVDPVGGTGKSYLNEWLFSLPEFMNYYLCIKQLESFLDMKEISGNKFVIDWDELPMSKKKFDIFKGYVVEKGGSDYSSKTKSYVYYKRWVNFIGSTNKGNRKNQKGYLLDEDLALMRRIAPIEVDTIDWQTYLQFDLRQIWAQAAHEILKAQAENNTQLLSWDCDFDNLRNMNRRYVNHRQETEAGIISRRYKPCDIGEGEKMTAKEIINELQKDGVKITITPVELGIYFRSKNYKKTRKGMDRAWWVVKTN